jgi:hypothetical protein
VWRDIASVVTKNVCVTPVDVCYTFMKLISSVLDDIILAKKGGTRFNDIFVAMLI